MKNKEIKNINYGISSKKLATLIIASQSIAFTATAVEIAPYIPSGEEASYIEAEPNLWFVLDDSGSMTWADQSNYLPYDSSVTYPLPTKIDGTPMPLPNGRNDIYITPFRSDANGTTSNVVDTGDTSVPHINCDWVTNVTNCKIWLNYYSIKDRTLKSALSVVMFNDENRELTERIRVGYRALNRDGNTLPVLPFYGENADSSRDTMKRWLYGLNLGGGTPLRRPTYNLLNDIYYESVYTNSPNNPFLQKPGEAPNTTDNKILSCRRNYMLVMTDGQWNGSNPPLNGMGTVRVNNSYTLPDGKGYTPIAPYRRSNLAGGRQSLADIAFAGWKRDLDNNNSTNNLKPKYIEIDEVVPTLNGSKYWHPWNDPANWQHVNTYTMGFRVAPLGVNVNPPTLSSAITQSSWEWNLSMSGNQIGYNSASRDLANAALAGRGRYYDVRTPIDMIDAFKNLLLQTKGKATNISVTGSSGVAGSSQKAGNSFFSTRYDSNNSTGSLLRYDVYNGSNADTCFTTTPDDKQVYGATCDTPFWDAAKKLTQGGVSNRQIISRKRKLNNTDLSTMDPATIEINQLKYTTINFDVSNISNAQRNRLITNFPDVLNNNFDNDSTRLNKLFAYIKGSAAEEATKFRKRNEYEYSDGSKARNILGAIVRSQPVYAGVPQASIKHLTPTSTAYANYLAFVRNFTSNNTNAEQEMLYVGGNDGMLHAFKADTGQEVFAYVPSAVYDKLPQTVVPNHNVSLVDGKIALTTVNLGSDTSNDDNNGNWRRVLVGSMGAGARGLYALDVTTPTKTAIKNSTLAKWEYSDLESILYQKKKNNITTPIDIAKIKSNVGNITDMPTILQLHDNTWVALTGNGYNSQSGKAALLVINLKTGKPIQELVLENSTYTDSGQENGLGPVTVQAYPNKARNKRHLADRAYAGDLQGNLWVFDLVGSNKNDGIKVVKKDGQPMPLFSATAKIGADEVKQPITVAPLVTPHPLGYGNLIHFGTGSLFTRDDASSTIPNSVYAIWDDWISKDDGGLPKAVARTSIVSQDQLNDIELEDKEITITKAGVPVTKIVRVLKSPSPTSWALQSMVNKHRGWKVDLRSGERAWQHAQIRYTGVGVSSITYKTANYHANGNNNTTGTPGIQDQCNIDKKDVQGSTLAFNMDDAARTLGGSGALDIDEDFNIGSSDLVGGVPASGVTTLGAIPYNSVSSEIEPPKCDPSDPNYPTCNPPPSSNCQTVAITNPDSTDPNGTPVPVTVCSSFSSWQELK